VQYGTGRYRLEPTGISIPTFADRIHGHLDEGVATITADPVLGSPADGTIAMDHDDGGTFSVGDG
jgi:hypothetical protein